MMIDTKSRTLLIIDMKPFCYVMLEVVRHCFKQIQKCPCFRIFRIKSIGVGSHAMDITTKMISCDMNNNLSLISLLLNTNMPFISCGKKITRKLILMELLLLEISSNCV